MCPALNPKLVSSDEMDSHLSKSICVKMNAVASAKIRNQHSNHTFCTNNCYVGTHHSSLVNDLVILPVHLILYKLKCIFRALQSYFSISVHEQHYV